MYFKSLEIFGFKSFAEKTKLEFEPGVTAIVGPNGCGKSNILDSIRWVLGEQSIKSLRGVKTEDVIFNGTELAEPINMAEVSLTLSNHSKLIPVDYEEITITRRLFRSGDSEYLLNKTPVRLKDITEILMGTGIGTESYSIIGQGKIDAIISSDEEARREIFEEASGITKYKSKKKEALRKLEQTEENLLRINDIIQEVKRQINSITRSVQKAERYKERFDELKNIELKLARYDFKNFSFELENALKFISSLKLEEETVSREMDSASIDFSGLRRGLSSVEEKHGLLKDAISKIDSAKENFTNKIELDKERIDDINKRSSNLSEEVNLLEGKIKGLGEVVGNLKAKFEEVSSSDKIKSDELKLKSARIEAIEKEIKDNLFKIEESKNKIVNDSVNLSKVKNEIVKITSDMSNRSQRERRLLMEKETVNSELDAVNSKLNLCSAELEGVNTLFQETNTRKMEAEHALNKLTGDLGALESGINGLKNGLFADESKLAFFEDLVKKHEGFKESARAILLSNEKGELGIDGIYGAVCDLVIPKKGFEVALEVALGENADAIVVKDRHTALKLVDYLRDNNLGRATFLNMDAPLFPGNPRELPPNITGRLSDFVDCDAALKGFVNNILGDIFVVEDIKNFISENADFSKDGFKIISKKGEVCSRFLLSGGKIILQEETSLIGRETKIRDLKEAIAYLKSDIAGRESEKLVKIEESNSLKNNLDLIEAEAKKLELQVIDKNNQKEVISKEAKRLSDEIAVLDLELDEIKEIIVEFTRKKESCEISIKDMESEIESSQNFLNQAEVIINNSKAEREELIIRIAELKTEIGLIEKEIDGIGASLRLYESSFEAENKSLVARKTELEEGKIKVIELNSEIEALNKSIEDIIKERCAISSELDVVIKERLLALDTLKAAEERETTLQKRINEIRQSLHEAELKNKDISFKLDTLKNNIYQSYKIDSETLSVEMPPEDSSETPNLEETRLNAAELRTKLDSMGAVNLVAIEEHKELEERFSFLTKQQEDLVNAKDQLMKAIQKINKTTRELFIETFTKVQVEFKNFFRLLFGGGQAELMLLDERDIHETGIEIIVRPPGKKLQSISLLSGGEKALTAIALLFSILKIKPTPFCVLDEIDAPLDESNVDRFSRVLQEFIKSSQFIIITHNKKTIALADVMYGITMEKSGISKIVSVKFSDRAHKDEKTGVALNTSAKTETSANSELVEKQ